MIEKGSFSIAMRSSCGLHLVVYHYVSFTTCDFHMCDVDYSTKLFLHLVNELPKATMIGSRYEMLLEDWL